MTPRRLAPAVAIGLCVAAACGNDRLRRNLEAIQVVSGEPSVDQQLPGVQRGNPDAGPVFGGAAPYQVDTFTQPKVSKVDILWIIDDSPSMSPKQDRVKSNFVSFMKFLSDQQIDYHLGVITTDTFDPNRSGRLVNAAALSKPWIDQQTSGGNASSDFVKNASVGIGGSGDEKGLLAGMLALTAPLSSLTPALGKNCVTGECFLRPDAQLYTIVVSDEEDSSCAPIRGAGVGGGEGCDDAQASLSGFGSIAYWSRYFAGAKGPGGVSRLASIAATDDTFQVCKDVFAGACDPFINATVNKCANAPDCSQGGNFGHECCQALTNCSKSVSEKAQWCEVRQSNVASSTGPFYKITGNVINGTDLQGFRGCVARDTGGQVLFTAHHAPRYNAVAKATGGIATSICDNDYTPALEKLGLQASGLRSDFPLSRAPVDGTVAVAVNGTQVAPGTNTWQYVKCENGSPVNSIRFAKAALPPPNAKVAASYDVNVRGLTCN